MAKSPKKKPKVREDLAQTVFRVMRAATFAIGMLLFVGCGERRPRHEDDDAPTAAPATKADSSKPANQSNPHSVSSGSFSSTDPVLTASWLRSEYTKIQASDQRGNEFGHKSRDDLLRDLEKAVVGNKVAWRMPVAFINKGGMVMVGAVTASNQSDQSTRWWGSLTAKSYPPDNIAEQMLPPKEPRDWVKALSVGDPVLVVGTIRKLELERPHGRIIGTGPARLIDGWQVILSPGWVEPMK